MFYVYDPKRHTLEPLLQTPVGFKNARLFPLDGQIGVFTRPAGEAALRLGAESPKGSIGFTTVPSLDALTPDTIATAPLLPTQIDPYQWWAANDASELGDGRVALLAHVGAHLGSGEFEPGRRASYYPMLAIFDPAERGLVEGLIPVVRGQIPDQGFRNPRYDVLFPGAFLEGDPTRFTVGVDDSRAAVVTLAAGHPWREWIASPVAGEENERVVR